MYNITVPVMDTLKAFFAYFWRTVLGVRECKHSKFSVSQLTLYVHDCDAKISA